MARRGRQVAGSEDFGPLGRCTDIGVGERRDRFSTIAKRGRRCLREPAHGLRERGRAIARRRSLFADFGYPVTIMLAHTSARDVDGADFRPSREWVGCRARSARAWEGDRATAQSFRRLRVSGHNHACSHSGVGGRRGRFSTVEKRQWERVGCRARSARVWEGDHATARAVCRRRRFSVFSHLKLTCMHARMQIS